MKKLFWKDHGECKETQRHETCDNRRKKRLLSIVTKLSQNKMVFRKITGNRNE